MHGLSSFVLGSRVFFPSWFPLGGVQDSVRREEADHGRSHGLHGSGELGDAGDAGGAVNRGRTGCRDGRDRREHLPERHPELASAVVGLAEAMQASPLGEPETAAAVGADRETLERTLVEIHLWPPKPRIAFKVQSLSTSLTIYTLYHSPKCLSSAALF